MARAQNSVTVPLRILGEHIAVDAVAGGKPLRLVLDTGAGANVLTPDAARRLGLSLRDADFQVKGAGDAPMSAKLATIPELKLGALTLKRVATVVVPLPGALECDGLLGYPLFARFVTTLDYAARRVTLAPPGTRPGGVPVVLRLANNIPEVEASVDGIRSWFRLDTGAGDALTLFAPFVERNKLREKYPSRIETVVGRGVGGLLRGDMTRLESFTLGGYTIERLPADLSRQTGGAFFDEESGGNVGGSLIKRFIATLDYPGGRLYLTRGPLFHAPFEMNRTGLSLDFEEGKVSVVAVIPKSPAEDAGVREGDTITALDGTPVGRLKPGAVRAALRQRAGAQLRLSVQRGTEPPRDAMLTLKDLL